MEEQSYRFVHQLVSQQEAVIDDVTALTRDGDTLEHTHTHTCCNEEAVTVRITATPQQLLPPPDRHNF